MSSDGASSWRRDVGSATKRPRQRRPSMGSKPFAFHQTKGKFAAGVQPTDPERLDRIRKDALEDFNKATVERDRSVHEMAAMFASTASNRSELRTSAVSELTASDNGGYHSSSSLAGSLTKGTGILSESAWSAASSEAGSSHGHGRPSDQHLDLSRHLDDTESENLCSVSRESSLSANSSQPSKYTSVTEPSATELRARDLKQQHLEEARKLASKRSSHVKDIANAFKGGSKSENVEVFQKKRAEQEAAYRVKVHEGKETLKKTSQGTDAMYNFVLKVNLATSEGKERFMRRWAVGRLAEGEQPTPREGWKFLESLGIDVANKKVNKERRATTAPSSSRRPIAVSSGSASATTSNAEKLKMRQSCSASVHSSSRSRRAIQEPIESTESTQPTQSRGRSPVRDAVSKFGAARPSAVCSSLPGAASNSLDEHDDETEISAWEVAVNRAVGAMTKVDTDACAPVVRNSLRRRSGSEPRRASPQLRKGLETCRPTRSKGFWGSSTTVPAAPLTARPSRMDEPRDVSLSPSCSPVRFTLPHMWGEGHQGTPSERLSRSRGPSLERRVSSQSRRTSDGLSCANSTPPKGLRLTASRLSASPTRFSLSPSMSRTSERARPSNLATGEDSFSSMDDANNKVPPPPLSPARVSWDKSFGTRASGSLELPDRVRDRASRGVSDASDVDEDFADIHEHEEMALTEIREDFASMRASMASGDTLKRLSEEAFLSEEDLESDQDEDEERGADAHEREGFTAHRVYAIKDGADLYTLPSPKLSTHYDAELRGSSLGGNLDSLGKLTMDGDLHLCEGPGRASDDTEDAMARAQRLSELQTRLSGSKLVLHGTLSDEDEDEDEDDSDTVQYDDDDKDLALEMPGLETPRSFDHEKEITDKGSTPRPRLEDAHDESIFSGGSPNSISEREEKVVHHDDIPHVYDDTEAEEDHEHEDIFGTGADNHRDGDDEEGGGLGDAALSAQPDVIEVGKPSPDEQHADASAAAVAAEATFPVESSHGGSGGSMDLTCKEVLSASESTSDRASVSVYDADMSMSDAASERFSDESLEAIPPQSIYKKELDGRAGGTPTRESIDHAADDGDDEASNSLPRSSRKELKIKVDELHQQQPQQLPQEEVSLPPVRRLEWNAKTVEMGSRLTLSRYGLKGCCSDDESQAIAPADRGAGDSVRTAPRSASLDDNEEDEDESDAESVVEAERTDGRAHAPGTRNLSAAVSSLASGSVQSVFTSSDLGRKTSGGGMITSMGTVASAEVRDGSDLSALIALASSVPPPMGDADRSPTKTGGKQVGRSHRRQQSLLPNEFASDQSSPRSTGSTQQGGGSLTSSPSHGFSYAPSPRRPPMQFDFVRKATASLDSGEVLANMLLSPRTPTSLRLDQIAEAGEFERRSDEETPPTGLAVAAVERKASLSPVLLSAAGHASDFSDSEGDDVVDDDDGGKDEKDDAGSSETDLDEATGPETQIETAVEKVEQIIAMCEKSLKADPDKGLVAKAVGAERAYSKGVDGGHKTGDRGHTMGAASDDVAPVFTTTRRDRLMTAQTEDTTSPSSQRPSTPNDNSPGTDASGGEEAVPDEALDVDTRKHPRDDGRVLSDISNMPVAGDSGADAALASTVVALPCTPLPRTARKSQGAVATVTPNPSPAGSICPVMGPTPEKALESFEQESITGSVRGEVDSQVDGVGQNSGEAVPSLAPAPGAGGDADVAEFGPGSSGGRSERVMLEVSNSNPYEDFDAIHDRQLPVDHGKHNCGGPLGFLAFCRPRSSTFHVNPSTRGSGVEFFPTGSMDDSADLDRASPRGLLGFCTPGSRAAPFNLSTRGKGIGFFKNVEEGDENTRQECRTPAGVLPSTQRRPMASESCEVAGDRVKVSVDDIVEDAARADEESALDEGGNCDIVARSAGEGKASTEERHGIECGVS